MLWGVVLGGANPKLRDQLDKPQQFFWDVSYTRWGSQAFYIEETSQYDYQRLDHIYQAYGYEKDTFVFAVCMIFVIGAAWRLIAFFTMLLVDRNKKR